MIYKGQKLSDNLTQSQINMYKYFIDEGFTMEQLMTMFHLDDRVNKVLREPDVEEKIKLAEKVGEVIKVLDALDK